MNEYANITTTIEENAKLKANLSQRQATIEKNAGLYTDLYTKSAKTNTFIGYYKVKSVNPAEIQSVISALAKAGIEAIIESERAPTESASFGL